MAVVTVVSKCTILPQSNYDTASEPPSPIPLYVPNLESPEFDTGSGPPSPIHYYRPNLDIPESDFDNANVPPPPLRYYISNLDILHCGNAYSHSVWLYGPRNGPNSSISHPDFVHSLKSSLAKLLGMHPWIAGRVSFSKEDGRPYLCSNHKGIHFFDAYVDATMDELKDFGTSFLKSLCPLGESLLVDDYAISPVVMFQITKFTCGSYSIAMTALELIGDGLSYSNLFLAWSEVHRGLSISLPFEMDSSLLKARDPPRVLISPARDYVSKEPMKADVEEGLVQCWQYKDGVSSLVSKTFQLSSQKVAELVEEVERPGPFHYGKVTSFEATAAFIWKSVTHARDLPDDVITRYAYPINIRQYMDPPLPRGYFGNAIYYFSLPARAGDIKANHISYAAGLIHQDLNKFKNNSSLRSELVRSVIDWVEIELGKGNQVGYTLDCYSGTDIHSTYLINYPLCKADFGYGAPLNYHLVFNELYGDGAAFVTPTNQNNNDRSRQWTVQLPAHHMKKLLRTELFQRFLPNDAETSNSNHSLIAGSSKPQYSVSRL